MGLFINRVAHPCVYKNENKITEPNQGYLKIDYFSELLKRQENVNHTLFYSYHNLKMKNQLQESAQNSQWQDINKQLQVLNKSNLQYQQFAGDAIDRQHQLEQRIMKLHETLEEEAQLKQEMTVQLAEQASVNNQIASQINEVHNLQQQMTAQDTKQEDMHRNVLERLEKQEAMMEKITRQIDYFRSILFERTSHLVEKVENSYDLTATFFYKMLTGSDQPLTLMMMKEETQEKQRKLN